MNYSTAVMLINPSIRAVRGQYEEHGAHETFKTIDRDLKVGDFAVVESTTRWNITTIKVTSVDADVDFDSPNPVRWVIGKVDKDAHNRIKKMEDDAIELIKKGELRKRREDIRKNTLDAMTAGEISNMEIARIGGPIDPPKEPLT